MLVMRHDKILVSEIANPKESKGGILLTDEQGIKSNRGIVKAVNADTTLEIGQRVVFSEFAGTNIIVDGEKLLIIADESLWAVEE